MKEEYTYCDICEKDSLVKVFSPIRKRKQAKDKKQKKDPRQKHFPWRYNKPSPD